MTADDFLAWPGDGTGRKAQLIDGDVYTMAPASSVHARIQATLTHILEAAALLSRSGLNVLTEAAVQLRLNASANIRVPDIAGTFEILERGQQIIQEPVLLVEVLSPGNEDTTRDNIRAYASIPSVRQMLVVHSTRILAETYTRDAGGNWPANPGLTGPGEMLDVSIAGLHCSVAELYRGTWLAVPP